MRSSRNESGCLRPTVEQDPAAHPPWSYPPSRTLAHVMPKRPLRHGGGGSPRTLSKPPLRHGEGGPQKAARIDALRQAMAKLETAATGAKAKHLALGIPEIHARLPGPGLACGVLHEVSATAHGDKPAAFGFVFALTAAALRLRCGPAVLVAAQRAFTDFGRPYGHGLAQLGLDVDRLLIVETRSHKDALWAIEDTLRSRAAPALVAGVAAGDLDLTVSRRLNLAAAEQ